MIIWKMWKLPKTREDNLVKCGFDRGEARVLISILFTNYININNQNKIGSSLK